MRVTVKINRGGINATARSEGVFRDLDRRADQVIELAQAIAPEKTGEYKRSFRKKRIRVRGRAGVRVSNIADHALIVERGSGPHVIEAKNKKALHWPGAKHPVARVHHPGTPAFHVLRRALKAAGR